MPVRPIHRRTLLKGLLGGATVTIGLPFLEAFAPRGSAWAAGSGLPTRFGLFFWGNGNLPELWNPTGEGETWELSPLLTPLADIKSLISVVSGMSVKVENEVPHMSGAAGILSGAPLQTKGGETFIEPSIDQIIAAEIGSNTRFPSIETAAEPSMGLSYKGPFNLNPPEASPYALFERIFGAGFRAPGDEPIIDPTIALRRSVLDAVLEDANRLHARVGTADSVRLEQHLDGIRALELQLARLEEDPPDLAACVKPSEPAADYPDLDGRPQLSAVSRAMCDMMAMALACDQTRVFSHCFSYPVNNVLYPEISAGHHQLTHDEPGDQPEVQAIIRQIMSELAYLVQTLQNVEEGDGTLLDNCAILATSDVSEGRTHDLTDYPIITAGGAGGYLRQGIHYRSPTGENASKVCLTLIQSLGLSIGSFGIDEAQATSGLSAIER